MSEHSCWKFVLITLVYSLRVRQCGFVLLNRLRIVTNTVFSNPRPANNWKSAEMGCTQNIFGNALLHIYIQLIVLKLRFPAHALLTKERILNLSLNSNSNKVKNAPYNMTYSIASFNTTQKNDDFWLPGVESFPTIYNLNDFAVAILILNLQTETNFTSNGKNTKLSTK